MKKLLIAAVVALSPMAANAAQIVLAPANVYATTGDYNGTFSADNIFDQQTGAIDENAQDGSYWLNPDNGNVNAAISIDLGSKYRLSSFDLFNTHNAQYNDRGTGNFSIVASNSASFTTFTTIASGTLNPEQQGTPLSAQTFTSLNTGAYRYLQFRPTSVATAPDGVHQSPCCGTNPAEHVFGLNELRVSGVGAVPEPANWALMIGGFGLIGAASRRRRLAVA
ncbi:PEPxxWA-CTERM sorting domain-containing protein [Sphingomonas antarctica]|uniref:PEPxxWA-CTERM sorting domain-containing protein n=1 Tax=Sphingomonas antarctica TaxID=2040274 RepID=UPI0039E9BC57